MMRWLVLVVTGLILMLSGTLMDAAPLKHTQRGVTDTPFVQADGCPPLKLDTAPEMDAAHGTISMNRPSSPVWLLESFLLVGSSADAQLGR